MGVNVGNVFPAFALRAMAGKNVANGKNGFNVFNVAVEKNEVNGFNVANGFNVGRIHGLKTEASF